MTLEDADILKACNTVIRLDYRSDCTSMNVFVYSSRS